MRISYDPEVDAAYICFLEGEFQVTTLRLTEDIAIDYSPEGKIVGIEILSASEYLFPNKERKIELENIESVCLK